MPDSPSLPTTVFQLVPGHLMTDYVSRPHSPSSFEVRLIDADDGRGNLDLRGRITQTTIPSGGDVRDFAFDRDASADVVERLVIRDREVAWEAGRWTSRERGSMVDNLDELTRADLTNYVTEAVRVGAHALSVTGQPQEDQALERMLKYVGEKTADSTARAAELTERAVPEATGAVPKAAHDAKIAITEAGTRNRKEFMTAVAAAKQDMNAELRRGDA
ncbi:hypothetical protein GCM10022267_74320 [Lentzea roselyniae]|uniref:Uncharacterized protein n=1 Tax=Lentzea roselyniae TaxID=531940 RepID=A0ABP7C4Y1_9PSEU